MNVAVNRRYFRTFHQVYAGRKPEIRHIGVANWDRARFATLKVAHAPLKFVLDAGVVRARMIPTEPNPAAAVPAVAF